MADGISRLIEDKEFADKLGSNARKISGRIEGKTILEQWKTYIEKIIGKR